MPEHLRRNTRAGDIVARLGGDEFVVVMNQSKDSVDEYISHMNQIASRLEGGSALSCPRQHQRRVAHFPEDGTDAETLLERADERMYEAKRKKRWQSGMTQLIRADRIEEAVA